MNALTLFTCLILLSLSKASPFEETYDKIKKITWDSWPKQDSKDVQMVVSVSKTTTAYPTPPPTYKTTTTTTTTTTPKPPVEHCATSFSHKDILFLSIVRNKKVVLTPIVLDPSQVKLRLLAKNKFKIPSALMKGKASMVLNLDQAILSLLPPVQKDDIVLLTVLSYTNSKKGIGAKTFVVQSITTQVPQPNTYLNRERAE